MEPGPGDPQQVEQQQVEKKKQIKRGPGFTCLFCKKRFKGTSCEKTHIRRHIQEKPFECGLCDYAAPCLTDVSTHQRRMHSNLRLTYTVSGLNKPFKCTVCGMAFYEQSYLLHHFKLAHGNVRFGNNRTVVISHGAAGHQPSNNQKREVAGGESPVKQVKVVHRQTASASSLPPREPSLNQKKIVVCQGKTYVVLITKEKPG